MNLKKFIHDTKKPIHSAITLMDLALMGPLEMELVDHLMQFLQTGKELQKTYINSEVSLTEYQKVLDEAYPRLEAILQTIKERGSYNDNIAAWKKTLQEISQKLEGISRKLLSN